MEMVILLWTPVREDHNSAKSPLVRILMAIKPAVCEKIFCITETALTSGFQLVLRIFGPSDKLYTPTDAAMPLDCDLHLAERADLVVSSG